MRQSLTRHKIISMLLGLTLLINPFTHHLVALAADPDDPAAHSIATPATTDMGGTTDEQELTPPAEQTAPANILEVPTATAGTTGTPPPPVQRGMTRATSGYNYSTTVMTSQTYTVTQSGHYRLHVVGKGGDGGKGQEVRGVTTNRNSDGGAGGSSGSTGAYAVHDVSLLAGQQVTVSVSASQTLVTLPSGGTVYANAGVAGKGLTTVVWYETTYTGAEPNSAAGVTAGGGNVVNINGVQGNKGNDSTLKIDSTYRAKGGDAPIISAHPQYSIYTPKIGALGVPDDVYVTQLNGQSATSDSYNLGGAGAGGTGGKIVNFSGTDVQAPAGYGGSGGAGGVVLEIAPNNAPSISGGITTPSSVNRWQQSTISGSLPAGSDADGDPLTYIIEYAVNNSGTYTQLTTGSATSFTYNIPATNPSNVRFRVKAVDGFGAESGYIYSGWTSIVYNSPPTTPTGMTNPSAVNSWQATNVTFGCNAATDLNGDTLNYVWELAVNGGAWASVQTSTSRSFARPIVKPTDGYYQVRVRAFDGIEYSGYLTSGMVTITHDTVAPTIQVICTPEATVAWAKDSVTITVIVSDALSGLKTLTVPAGVAPSGNQPLTGTSATKTFTATLNGTYAFTITDNAGNSASASVSPSKIDTDSPTITYTTNPPNGSFTNGDVEINLTFADPSAGLESFSGLNGSEQISGSAATKKFTATANGVYPFSTTDLVGHTTAKNVNVNMIDRVKPTAAIIAQVSRWTNAASEIVNITGTDDYAGVLNITRPDGSVFAGSATTYTITNNGAYTANSTDRASNVSDTATLYYTWFDRTPPKIDFVSFEETENTVTKFFASLLKIVTNKSLRIEVDSSDTPDAGEGKSDVTHLYYRVFKSDNTLVQDWTSSPINTQPVINYEVNGFVEVYVKDAAGNSSPTETHEILIDTTSPTHEIAYSITEITDQPVIVTLKLIDEPDGSGAKGWILPDGGVLVNQSEISYTFSENAEKKFLGYDNAGNPLEVNVKITNIHSPKVPVSEWENNKPVIDAVLHAVGKNEIADISYADLLKPTYIDLSSNGMTSLPAVFSQIKNLEHLDLRGNEYTSIPDCVFALKRLKYLDVSNNNLSDISDEISKLTALETLDVSLNYLVDYELPAIIKNYRNIGNFTNVEQPEQYAFEIIQPDTNKEYIGNTTQFAVQWSYEGQQITESLESHRKALFSLTYPSYHTYRPMLYKYNVENGTIKTATADYVQVYLPEAGVTSVAIVMGAAA